VTPPLPPSVSSRLPSRDDLTANAQKLAGQLQHTQLRASELIAAQRKATAGQVGDAQRRASELLDPALRTALSGAGHAQRRIGHLLETPRHIAADRASTAQQRLIELLAAIPSVVYGVWALYVLAPWSLEHLETPISDHVSFIGFLGGPPAQTSLFTASLVLAIMILPTLSAVSRDVIRAVPRGLRENSVALGATWWETIWRVVLPSARAGIFGAVILALGRALGETIAVTMVIGNRYEIPHSIFYPAYTLASVIANEFAEATGTIYPAALVELGLVLILVTLTVNIVALLLVRSTAARAAI